MSRHQRFLLAFAVGLMLTIGSLAFPLRIELRALIGVNAFCLCYLGLMFRLAQKSGPDLLRRRAETSDEQLGVIVVLACLVVAASITAITLVLNGPAGGSLAARLTALLSVPLGWAMVHTLAAFHYAHLFYQPATSQTPAGLKFPGGKEPSAWDFIYFAFVIGMAAQVSDVSITTAQMRRVVLVHSVTSFFYNTIILALAVNAAVTITN